MTDSSTKPKLISRAKAIALLQAVSDEQMFGVKFVGHSRKLSGMPARVRRMSCKIDGKDSLRGGEQPNDPAQQAVMTVLQVLDLETACKRYQARARREIATLEPKVAKARQNLERAHRKLAAHSAAHAWDDAYLVSSVEWTERRLNHLEAKRDNALDKIDDMELAVFNDLQRSIRLVTKDLHSVRDAFGAGADKFTALRKQLETLQKLEADPMQTLLICHRQINLLGLVALTIDGVEYAVTTPPEPALPVDATK